ncbi:MAG TPA: SUMF1/EgtB/PvdO family nonheme iron enzyme [Geobacteraceae bacterium]
MIRTLSLFFVCILLGAGPATAAQIKNLKAQRDGDGMVFRYDLVARGGETADRVSLTVTVDGKSIPGERLHLEGDVGTVSVGKGKMLRWKVREDFPDGLSAEPGWEMVTGFRDPVTGMEFVFVKGGCFRMGDEFGVGNKDEGPVHEVCVDDFYLGTYEVTQKEWQQVMGTNSAYFKACGERCPVESVSWSQANAFLKKLRTAGDGLKFRLPSEAEWEYAARSGGKKEQWAGTSSDRELKKSAVFGINSGGKPHPVGSKRPNGLGLYDMSGNVWEWVSDFYDSGYYALSPRGNPQGPDRRLSRVLRGGGWDSQPFDLRAAKRLRGKEGTGSLNAGFRLALTP